ncbi:MAG: pilus assembly PilX N-terminal domain-containing protein [Methylovulum sp.]|nr:pilus assembly PilX N-terminal domain-containing protein [Methylovulum sp.]
MKTHPPPLVSALFRQRAAVTLLVVMMLIIAMAILTLTTSRTGMLEQKITGNDARSKEAFESAEAGIEYGLAYLTNNSSYSNYTALVWDTSGGNQSASPTASGDVASGDFSYTPTTTYQRAVDSNYIKVVSTAKETHDNSITATDEQYVYAATVLNNGPAFNAPPLAMDGCLSGVVGGPDIYVGTRADGIAAGTSHSPANQGAWDPDSGTSCLNRGHLDAHGGQPKGDLFTPGTVWSYIFGTFTREQIKAKADQEVAEGVADSDRTYIWVTDTGNYHDSWGSATHPVILVFAAAADCPKINGNPTIYGLVFIDSACTANGWGGATVYGSVIVNGNVDKLNANTAIYDWTATPGATNPLGNSFIDTISKIPGTWKDF